MKNPITIIKKDHRALEALFADFESLGEKAFVKKNELSDIIIDELTKHAKMEEKYLYPRLKDAFSDEDDKLVEEAEAEHHVVKITMMEIKMLPPQDPQFIAKMTLLKELVNHHVKEEEKEMLPLAEKQLSKDHLATIGEEMVKFKENAKKSLVEKLLTL